MASTLRSILTSPTLTTSIIQEFNAPAVEESEMDVDPLLQLVAKKP
ncbi:3424_t:CDS:2 [Gigaspora margarita]|uniref:3424_t:CDS:1 n=1 Tax=Gigaspora margarita TaxID=4874 RepID=A0ABN7U6I9_GIGMA|nr:3424_t:CDS:2 [Gigaspora margarita]